MSETHQSRVLAGHKAALKNPNVSEEAKEHSREVIAELSGEQPSVETEQSGTHNLRTARTYQQDPDLTHDHRVAAGYKATLHNPRTSEAAKEHAREVLDEMSEDFKDTRKDTSLSSDEVHDHRVLGGYKATLSNPNTSEEAKQHAREVLAENDQVV